MLVWGRRTPYPAASLAAEWTGSLVHFPACPDMQEQWAWQKQSWKTGRESGSPKLFSVSGRKRKGSVKKCLHHLFSLGRWCLMEGHLLLDHCIYFFLKVLSSCKYYLDLARRSFPLLLNPLTLKLQARTVVSVCLRASGLEQQQRVGDDPQITFLCSFRAGHTTQPHKNLPPTAPGGSGMLTAISYISEARIRPSGLKWLLLGGEMEKDCS